MRLTKIELENFKGIGGRQSIDLRPVTLLFGANSAGKSTVLQALHYTREILERKNADPDQTLSGVTDLGGFKSLVHKHESERSIGIRLVIDMSDEQGSDWLPLNTNTGYDEGMHDLSALHIRYILGQQADHLGSCLVEKVGVSLEVSWSERLDSAYVSLFSVEINDEMVGEIKSPPQQGHAIITNINFKHPLLLNSNDPDEQSESNLLLQVEELSRQMAKAQKDQIPSVAVACVLGALPDLDSSLRLQLRDPNVDAEEEERTAQVKGLTKLLDELVAGPGRIVRDYLRLITYIGPLREIPSRNFRPQQSLDESRWATGLAAWDLMCGSNAERLLEKVNDWLNSEEKLGTDYRVEKRSFKEIALASPLSLLLDQGLSDDNLSEAQDLYLSLPVQTELSLRDYSKGISVAPSDVGIGVSQMIPVVVACLNRGSGLLAIEQPELHIHPAVQVGMGDLFIETADSEDGTGLLEKSLLVETHSEHIMLRLLRRIRETAENELPPGAPSFSPESLAVIYVENDGDGVQYKKLRVDSDGDFIDRWPSGFFDERAEELF